MELKIVDMKIPEGANLVLGQSHFIKTAEDIYEVMAVGVGEGRLESSWPRLVPPCSPDSAGGASTDVPSAR